MYKTPRNRIERWLLIVTLQEKNNMGDLTQNSLIHKVWRINQMTWMFKCIIETSLACEMAHMTQKGAISVF